MTCQSDKGLGGPGPYDKGLQKGEPKMCSCFCFSGSTANPWCEVGKLSAGRVPGPMATARRNRNQQNFW